MMMFYLNNYINLYNMHLIINHLNNFKKIKKKCLLNKVRNKNKWKQ